MKFEKYTPGSVDVVPEFHIELFKMQSYLL
jgi:hypothetical protein